MTDPTRLDTAFTIMDAAPEDAAARLRFYETLATSELFLLLESEAQGDRVEPEVIDIQGQDFVLAFDLESRMMQAGGGAVPYAALSGRALCAMLAPHGIGIALNPDAAPSSFFIPPEAVIWLAETLSAAPQEVEQNLEKLFSPKGLPHAFLAALDARLGAATGLAQSAWLVGVAYRDGSRGHLLAYVDALPAAQPELTRIAMETLAFSGLEAAILDVGFVSAADPVAPRLARVGLRFELPQPIPSQPSGAPGMDPEKPPRIK